LYLSKIVEVVLSVDPAVGRSFVETIGLVTNIADVRSVTVIEQTFEELHVIQVRHR